MINWKSLLISIIGIALIIAIIYIYKQSTSGSDQQTNSSLSSPKTHNLEQLNWKEAKYLVVHSNILDEGFTIEAYGDHGKLLDDISVDLGQKIDHLIQIEDTLFLVSERKNLHFEINHAGEVSTFSAMPEKYEKDSTYGATLLRERGNYLFYTVNVGIGNEHSPNLYGNELFYKRLDEDNFKHLMVEGYINWVDVQDQLAYVGYENPDQQKIGVYLLDLQNNRILQENIIDNIIDKTNEELGNRYYPTTTTLYQGSILMTMVNGYADPNIPSYVYIINPKTGALLEKLPLPDRFFPIQAEINHDKLYIFSSTGAFLVMNERYIVANELRLEWDQQFQNDFYNHQGVISSIQLTENEIYVLYQFINQSPENQRKKIHIYDLTNGKRKQTLPITNDNHYEISRLFLID